MSHHAFQPQTSHQPKNPADEVAQQSQRWALNIVGNDGGDCFYIDIKATDRIDRYSSKDSCIDGSNKAIAELENLVENMNFDGDSQLVSGQITLEDGLTPFS